MRAFRISSVSLHAAGASRTDEDFIRLANTQPPIRCSQRAVAPANQVMTSQGMTSLRPTIGVCKGSDSKGTGAGATVAAGFGALPAINIAGGIGFVEFDRLNVAIGAATITASAAHARPYQI